MEGFDRLLDHQQKLKTIDKENQMKIHTKTFARLSPMDQRDNLAAWERDATEAAERGLTPADRARGRRVLKRIKKLWEEFVPQEQRTN